MSVLGFFFISKKMCTCMKIKHFSITNRNTKLFVSVLRSIK